jgi:predicted HTH domain antitoxin
MSKVNIQIEIPEELAGTEREERLLERIQKHAIEQAVLELYKEGMISIGTGARLLGLPMYDFIEFLGMHDLSIFPSTEEEVAAEMDNFERERKRLALEAQDHG